MTANFSSTVPKLMTFSDMRNGMPSYQATGAVQANNFDNSVKLKTQPDTDVLDKKNDNKKMLVKGGIILAAVGLAIAGFCVLRGRGKEKAAQAGSDIAGTVIKATGADETTAKAANEAVQNVEKILEGINNPKLNGSMYAETPVCFDGTSVEKDMAQWIKRLQNAPQEASVVQRGEHVRINNPVDIKALGNIKPHNYTDTSDIFIDTRTLHTGFPDGFAVVNGKMGNMQSSYNEYVDYALGKSRGDYGYRAGISKDGRACVELHFKEKRHDEAGRIIHTHVLLRSKDKNFTQDQLDAIKMFQNIDEESIALDSPLGAAFIQEDEGAKTCTSLFFNRNMFLSIIKNEADKHKDFDVQGLLSKGNVERYIDEYAMLKRVYSSK